MRLLQVTTAINKDIKKLLTESVIGTPGRSMLYQHKSIEERIRSIKNPFFVELRTKFGLAGVCCFCYRETINHGISYPSFYIRYFSFKEKYRAAPASQEKKHAGKLRAEIKELLKGDGLKSFSAEKSINYAYVDLSNIRSASLCKDFGFQEVRRFTTFIYSRGDSA
jgi:hypothetical protein